MKVVKNSGEVVDFSLVKLQQSLLKSGASELVVDAILQTINKETYEGISTKQIYKMAFNMLKKAASSNAARYNLKEAIRLLGPEGFYFEKYVARLFNSEGYKTQTNVILKGKCVSHEIDVLAKKDQIVSMVECKFHMGKDIKSDVKVPMYILSRFNDLKEMRHTLFSGNELISGCWIVTNSRFTKDAIDFGTCSGIKLMSWDYPETDNLKTKIENKSLYPISCLTTLSMAEKDKLLILDIILVKEIIANPDCLKKIEISPNRIKNILREALELCEYTSLPRDKVGN